MLRTVVESQMRKGSSVQELTSLSQYIALVWAIRTTRIPWIWCCKPLQFAQNSLFQGARRSPGFTVTARRKGPHHMASHGALQCFGCHARYNSKWMHQGPTSNWLGWNHEAAPTLRESAMPAREASVFFCVLYHVVSTLELLDIGLAGRLTQMRPAANCLRRALLTRPVLKSVSKSRAQLVAMFSTFVAILAMACSRQFSGPSCLA